MQDELEQRRYGITESPQAVMTENEVLRYLGFNVDAPADDAEKLTMLEARDRVRGIADIGDSDQVRSSSGRFYIATRIADAQPPDPVLVFFREAAEANAKAVIQAGLIIDDIPVPGVRFSGKLMPPDGQPFTYEAPIYEVTLRPTEKTLGAFDDAPIGAWFAQVSHPMTGLFRVVLASGPGAVLYAQDVDHAAAQVAVMVRGVS